MPMSFDTRFLIAKLQTARGVAADYAGADLIPALELTHRPLEADRQSRDLVDGNPGATGADFLSRPRARVTATLEASAAAALGDAPFWGGLAQACGLAETLTATTSAAYTPRQDDAFKWATLVGGFGGSQGASIFSNAPVKAIAALPEAIRRRLVVTHQARDKEMEAVKAGYAAAGVRTDVAPFFKDLPARMAAAHLVISRAGASTVTELAAIGRPSILVPLAIAMDDHQTGNARALADRKAALILPEKGFSAEILSGPLAEMLSDPERLQAMAAAAHGAVKSGAASRLADLVEGILGK